MARHLGYYTRHRDVTDADIEAFGHLLDAVQESLADDETLTRTPVTPDMTPYIAGRARRQATYSSPRATRPLSIELNYRGPWGAMVGIVSGYKDQLRRKLAKTTHAWLLGECRRIVREKVEAQEASDAEATRRRELAAAAMAELGFEVEQSHRSDIELNVGKGESGLRYSVRLRYAKHGLTAAQVHALIALLGLKLHSEAALQAEYKVARQEQEQRAAALDAARLAEITREAAEREAQLEDARARGVEV